MPIPIIVINPPKILHNGVPIEQRLLPIVQQTNQLYQTGLRRFCYQNVVGYIAPVVGNAALPDTPELIRVVQFEPLSEFNKVGFVGMFPIFVQYKIWRG